MHQVTFTVDKSLRITSWDKALEAVSGRTSPQMQGRVYHQVLPRIAIEGGDAIECVLREGRVLDVSDYRFPCIYGEVSAEIRISPVGAETGETRGAQVSIRSTPCCTLASRLQQSQPLIDIGKIASTLAHGVRNPLNAIKGGVVYLKSKYADESTLVEFADMMEEEIARLDSFITRFLSTSFFDNELSETDLNALLKKIETYTSLQAAACGLTNRFEYGQVPLVKINPFQMEQAILNIVNNSIDAMVGGGELMVRSSTESIEGRDFAIVEISDTGPGMPDTRLVETPVPTIGAVNGTGRGFGLFIAREVIQHHGGRLEIRSVKGAGTTVKVCLPAM